MAAVLADGTTVIDNVAREPEIIDLCEMLVEMGAKIEGDLHLDADRARRRRGSQPVEHDDRHRPDRRRHLGLRRRDRRRRPDRPRAAVAATSTSCSTSWSSAGASVSDVDGGFHVHVDRRLDSFDVVTLPYPGFPTDLQPFAMALAAVSDGTAMITENVFEARFMFAQELARLGADLRTDGHHAVVRGQPLLSGAPVVAHDIRAGAALVLAGLAAQGTTTVAESQHIDRGYPYFVEMLARPRRRHQPGRRTRPGGLTTDTRRRREATFPDLRAS